MEEYLYEKLEKRPPARPNNLELLGECMVDSGHEFGHGTAYGERIGAPPVVRQGVITEIGPFFETNNPTHTHTHLSPGHSQILNNGGMHVCPPWLCSWAPLRLSNYVK